MSLIKPSLLALLSLFMLSNAHAIRINLNDSNLRDKDGFHIRVGYQRVGTNDCTESNIVHGFDIEWLRQGYTVSTPAVTSKTAKYKICINAMWDKGGAGHGGWEEAKAVKNVEECSVTITGDGNNRFQYSNCGT